MLPGLEGVFLPWSRFVGGHPRDGRLRVREDGDRTEPCAYWWLALEGLPTHRSGKKFMYSYDQQWSNSTQDMKKKASSVFK